jgi:hypothetical protein
MLNRDNAILELTGKPGTASYGVIAPSYWGRTKLQLQRTRLVEKTQKLIARRHCTVLLTQIDSVEIVEEGNPLWLILGVLTIFIVIGLVFFILYFVFKHKYLAIRSGNNIQLVMVDSSNAEQAEQFMNAVLKHAEELQPQKV